MEVEGHGSDLGEPCGVTIIRNDVHIYDKNNYRSFETKKDN